MTERSWVIHSSAVPVSARELLHLGEDLRLDGDVERRRRLVGDEHRRPVQQRDGDRDALAHAARELVRIGVEPLLGRRDADAHERLPGALARRLFRHALVRPDRLDHLRVDAQHRVQRRHRILEDHGDALAAQAAQLLLRQAEQLARRRSRIEPAAMRPGASMRPRIGKPGDRLARARFADEPQHLAARRGRRRRRRPRSARPRGC